MPRKKTENLVFRSHLIYQKPSRGRRFHLFRLGENDHRLIGQVYFPVFGDIPDQLVLLPRGHRRQHRKMQVMSYIVTDYETGEILFATKNPEDILAIKRLDDKDRVFYIPPDTPTMLLDFQQGLDMLVGRCRIDELMETRFKYFSYRTFRRQMAEKKRVDRGEKN